MSVRILIAYTLPIMESYGTAICSVDPSVGCRCFDSIAAAAAAAGPGLPSPTALPFQRVIGTASLVLPTSIASLACATSSAWIGRCCTPVIAPDAALPVDLSSCAGKPRRSADGCWQGLYHSSLKLRR